MSEQYMNNQARAEVEWYRQHGKYPERIVRDDRGHLYVVGDWAWNARHPTKREQVEGRMPRLSTAGSRR